MEKDMHMGPLDYQQQNTFLQIVNENEDIYASSQLDIRRTNLLQHEINTDTHAPITK